MSNAPVTASSSTPNPAFLKGNWLVVGSLPVPGPGQPSLQTFGLAVTLDLINGELIGSVSEAYPCTAGAAGGAEGLATETVAGRRHLHPSTRNPRRDATDPGVPDSRNRPHGCGGIMVRNIHRVQREHRLHSCLRELYRNADPTGKRYLRGNRDAGASGCRWLHNPDHHRGYAAARRPSQLGYRDVPGSKQRQYSGRQHPRSGFAVFLDRHDSRHVWRCARQLCG